MTTILPTGTFGSWTVTSLRNSLSEELARDSHGTTLRMFFYAITHTGWTEIQKQVLNWKRAKVNRSVTVFVGTDHAITDPSALESMNRDGIEVRLMSQYNGVYHPKVIWLTGTNNNLLWIGSNNLTRDGLLHNIEFAALIQSQKAPTELSRWADAVADGSITLTDALIASYKNERDVFEKGRAKANATTFTWSQKSQPVPLVHRPLHKGDLILEVMPEETRGGNQIQLPKDAAREFLGLHTVGDQKWIELQRLGAEEPRRLLITVFKNSTVRVSINELEYGDRPCVIVFHRTHDIRFQFDIVPENIFPTRYRELIALCTRRTRTGSRRWTIH